MIERGITVDAVVTVLQTGAVIERHRTETPSPSRLMLGWIDGTPLHVVCAEADPSDGEIFVVTVYRPDPTLWDPTFTRRLP